MNDSLDTVPKIWNVSIAIVSGRMIPFHFYAKQSWNGMSLFDVIKYPISTSPTTEQIEALPPQVRKVIGDMLYVGSLFRNRSASLDARTICIMYRQPANKATAIRIIEAARKALLEIE